MIELKSLFGSRKLGAIRGAEGFAMAPGRSAKLTVIDDDRCMSKKIFTIKRVIPGTRQYSNDFSVEHSEFFS